MPLASSIGILLRTSAGGSVLRLTSAHAADVLTWAPATNLGFGMKDPNFWLGGDIDSASNVLTDEIGTPLRTEVGLTLQTEGTDQAAALAPFNISFVGSNFTVYDKSAPSHSGLVNYAVRGVLALRPYLADLTQMELQCAEGNYEILPGQVIVLSQPLSYNFADGSVYTFPAQTLLIVVGSTIGTWRRGVQTKPSTVRLSVGYVMVDAGPQAPPVPTKLLHRNFYLHTDVVRYPINAYVAHAAQWLADGFNFDHGGLRENWRDLIDLFGAAHVAYLREQEWAYFGRLGWDATRVIISDEHAPNWDVVSAESSWNTTWKEYFQTFLYPKMRLYFPNNTLAFGMPRACSVDDFLSVCDWWPSDGNTALRLHALLDGGSGPPTGIAAPGLDAYEMTEYCQQITDKAIVIGVPKVYFQNLGCSTNAGERIDRLVVARAEMIARSWWVGAWAGAPDGDTVQLLSDTSGVWLPTAAAEPVFDLL